MTESLLQNLEEKVMQLLMELETARHELTHLKHENTSLKVEKANSMKKLQELLSLFDMSTHTSSSQIIIAQDLEAVHG